MTDAELATNRSIAKLAEISVKSAGVQLQTMADMWTLATSISAAGMAPRGMNTTQVMVSIQMGAEIGVPPMTALRNIAIINGRPAIWGDLPLAQAERSGKLVDISEVIEGAGDKMVATCTIVKRGRSTPYTSSFSVTDAKTAKLWGKAGPWTEYPRRMLALRARAFAIRDAFPECLGGFYLREEAEDIPVAEAKPVGSAGLLNKLKPVSEPFEDEPTDADFAPLPNDGTPDDGDWQPSPEEIEEIRAREIADARAEGLFPEEEE